MPDPSPPSTNRSRETNGVLFAVCGYAWWAWLTPIYFHVLRFVPPLELLAWRVVAGLPSLLILLWIAGRQDEVRIILRDKRTLMTLAATGLLISINWFCFVWAVVTDRLAEASLGYYMNPLVSVGLGFVFLGERLRGFQIVAIWIAVTGVIVMSVAIGNLPWIALGIASSYPVYGLLRKTVNAGPAAGLTVEMFLLLPIMFLLLLFVELDTGMSALDGPAWVTILLLLGGVQTIGPLLFYVAAAKRLRLATLGLLQFIAPTGQLMLAVLAFGEPFGPLRGIAFALIWIAVIMYSIDSVRRARLAATAS